MIYDRWPFVHFFLQRMPAMARLLRFNNPSLLNIIVICYCALNQYVYIRMRCSQYDYSISLWLGNYFIFTANILR